MTVDRTQFRLLGLRARGCIVSERRLRVPLRTSSCDEMPTLSHPRERHVVAMRLGWRHRSKSRSLSYVEV